MEFLLDENIILAGGAWLGVMFVIFGLALVFWALRDIRSRSRDRLLHILTFFLVLILNIPGALIYLLMRPRETLADAYERSLEEEALLQEIEEKPTCPGCGQRVHADWQACPHCHTRLKKACIKCQKMLELSWNLCPYCATGQVSYGSDNPQVRISSHLKPTYTPEPPDIPSKWLANDPGNNDSIEFVDE